MPARVYMGVDARRDHSLRVPRPDLAGEIGAPDACTACHVDRPAAWAAEAVRGWVGEDRSVPEHYGQTLHAGRRGQGAVDAALPALALEPGRPSIVMPSPITLPENGIVSTAPACSTSGNPRIRCNVSRKNAAPNA